MTDKLEPGWYWVRLDGWQPWEVAFMAHGGRWRVIAEQFPRHDRPAIIGPRLTPPEGSS